MKKIIITVMLLFSINAYSQTGWQVQTPPRFDVYSAVYFINNNTGWIAGEFLQTFLKTTNAGENWVLMPDLPTNNLTTIQFLNELTGWVAGSSGWIMKTTSSGLNWFYVNCYECTNVDDFQKIQFLNPDTGYAMGDQNIFKSTDSGLNWVKLNNNHIVFNGYFLNTEVGWTSCLYGIAKTNNGGANWEFFQLSSPYLIDIYFEDSNIGWCISSNSIIYKSSNGGDNWNIQYRDSTKNFKSIYFSSYDTGWVVGKYGCVIKITNGGLNWFQQNVPNVDYNCIFMLSSIEGWIVGNNTILYTNDGGGSVDIKPVNNKVPEGFSLYQNYPNPFNPNTKIKFQIAKLSDVKLAVYDILCREVATLVNERLKAGTYEVEFEGSSLPSGVYFYTFITESFKETKRMVLTK